MTLCDNHTHTCFSFDGDGSATPDAMCEAAIAKGVKYLAITDHNDINVLFDHSFPPYHPDEAREAVLSAQKKYAGKLFLSYGIELGQAMHYPEASRAFIDAYKPQTVIGSTHSLRDTLDFFDFDMSALTEEAFRNLWDRYLDDVYEMLDFDGINILAHLSYPCRCLNNNGLNYGIEYSYGKIEKVCRKAVAKNICLEMNTSGYRMEAVHHSVPDIDIIGIYRDCGGRYITLGSDSHDTKNIAADFDKAAKDLLKIGINEVCFAACGDILTFGI